MEGGVSIYRLFCVTATDVLHNTYNMDNQKIRKKIHFVFVFVTEIAASDKWLQWVWDAVGRMGAGAWEWRLGNGWEWVGVGNGDCSDDA